MNHHGESAAFAAGEKETGRLEAFSDGVFAFAITLLALDVKIPHLAGSAHEATAGSLLAGLREAWPSYLAFVTSFFSVLIMWVHHHNLFRRVRRTDTTLLFANGFLLMLVTVAPFPTAVVAEYIRTPAASAACGFYAGYFVLVASAFYLLLLAALRQSVCNPHLTFATLHRLRRSYALGPPLYLAAGALAPVSPWMTMAICTALWILWAVTARDCAPTSDVPAQG